MVRRLVCPLPDVATHGQPDVETGGNGFVRMRDCGFYKLYQIDKGSRSYRTEGLASGRVRPKIRGLKSPWGVEGAVCSHFHWQRDYLLWGISWVNVQLMLADMPSVDYSDDRVVNTDSEEEVAAFIRSL